MIEEIRIENYKSIQNLHLPLGEFTLLIGENGCGKSNILEAIALSSAGANNKPDNEFLASRGIRMTEPPLMRSAFEKESMTQKIKFFLKGTGLDYECLLQNENKPYSKWINQSSSQPGMEEFLIYSPEDPALRMFEKEGQIQPLGIKGEGLLKLLKVLSLQENREKLEEVKEKLRLIDWFHDLEISSNFSENENRIQIKDKYLDQDLDFDQKSSNEGFLFLLFYFALFISSDTPGFFAIDNIDASLNPKLCSKLIKELRGLGKKHQKQVILTTHNPAVLDGLNLDDPEQKLFVIYRNKTGHTKAKQILKPQPLEGQEPVKLSESFLRGYLGGLPKSF